MSTLQDIKDAAAKLPAVERSESVAWLSESRDVWEIRREHLRREIQLGLDDIQQGNVAPLDMEAIKSKARALHEAKLKN